MAPAVSRIAATSRRFRVVSDGTGNYTECMKRIVVSGGTGYIGRALVEHLVSRGDSVTVLTRGASGTGNPSRAHWDPYQLGDWAKALDGADAVVHLAGERAVGVRFTEANKRRIRDSRVITTGNVVKAIAAASVKPRVLVSVSGIGYYGDRPAPERIDESCGPGDDFLARLCIDWEGAAQKAREVGVRVVNPRMGIVFGPGGGALQTMALPFKLFAGGKIGSGKQGISWIHLDDAVRALALCIDDESLPEKLNVCAPNPASNAEISTSIAETLHRPNWIPVPAFGIKALFGEGAEPILTGQYALPGVLSTRGFAFAFERVQAAIAGSLQ
jgi:uncharacterized protein (TIGR01777 family)